MRRLPYRALLKGVIQEVYRGPVGPKVKSKNHHKTYKFKAYEAEILSTPT